MNILFIQQQKSLLHRISTFRTWPGTSVLSPLKFANSGFSYTGKSDDVVCFACNIHLNGWSANDNPLDRHKRIAPDCPFLKEGSSGNVILTIVNDPEWTFTANDIATATVTDNADLDVDRAVPQTALLDPLKQLYFNVLHRARRKGLLSNDSDFQKDRQFLDFDKLRLEEERLLTFQNWPSSSHANPEALARAGLFYTGTDDRVQCAFCRGFIRDWTPSDSPAAEHKKLYPDCTFARDLEVGISPIVRDLPQAEDRIRNENDGEFRNTVSHPPREAVTALTAEQIPRSLLARRSEFPKYPQYSELFARIQSLRGGIVAHGQTAQSLADAGWFYIGPGDKVFCFHCGGNLKDWEYHDDPWEEHEKWYPDCAYLLNHRPSPRLQVSNPTSPALSIRFRYIEPREIKARLDTPATRLVLDMGYSNDLVRSAIEKRMVATGDDFPDAQSLLEAIFQLEDEHEMLSQPSPLSGLRQNSAILRGYNSYSNTTTGYNSISSTAPPTTLSANSCTYNQRPEPQSSSSLPGSSVAPFQSMIQTTSYKPIAPAAATMTTIPEPGVQGQSKAKSKKKNKKTATSGTGGGNQSQEEPAATFRQNNKELVQENLRSGEIPDEEPTRYIEENRRMREARTCKVCKTAEVNTVFLPCGHLVCCNNCSPKVRDCPFCRAFIRGTVKTFLS